MKDTRKTIRIMQEAIKMRKAVEPLEFDYRDFKNPTIISLIAPFIKALRKNKDVTKLCFDIHMFAPYPCTEIQTYKHTFEHFKTSDIKNIALKIKLSSLAVGRIDKRVNFLAEILKHNKPVTKVEIVGCHQIKEEISIINKALIINHTMHSLKINLTSMQKGKQFLNALEFNKTLLKLNLNTCSLDDEKITVLARVIAKNQNLVDLDVSYNNLNGKGTELFAEALTINKGLCRLNLATVSLNSKVAVSLANALKENHTLRILNLSSNNLEGEGLIAIAEALELNQSLTDLNISHNYFGSEGIKYFATALTINSTLRKLNLTSNNLGSQGVAILVQALEKNQGLSILNLSYNRLGNQGAKLLAEGLTANKTLQTIDLRGNHLKDEGIKFLAQALQGNKAISELELSDNYISNIEECKDALKANNNLLSLNFNNNKVLDEGNQSPIPHDHSMTGNIPPITLSGLGTPEEDY